MYTVDIQKMRTDPDDKSKERLGQQWSYDAKEKSLRSRLYPKKVMFEGFNKNLIIFDWRAMKNQKFSYDTNSNNWFNDFTNQAIMPEGLGEIAAGGHIVTDKMSDKNIR